MAIKYEIMIINIQISNLLIFLPTFVFKSIHAYLIPNHNKSAKLK